MLFPYDVEPLMMDYSLYFIKGLLYGLGMVYIKDVA